MHQFRDGDAAKILRHGIEVELFVFRQCGELVYVFDRRNHLYRLPVRDLMPAGSFDIETRDCQLCHGSVN